MHGGGSVLAAQENPCITSLSCKPAIFCGCRSLWQCRDAQACDEPNTTMPSMRAVQFSTLRARSVARQGRVWCWAFVLSLLLAQSLGAWHRVAHAAQLELPRLDPARAISVARIEGSSASVSGAVALLQHGLEALFAHHSKVGGHLDCVHLDQASHGAGPSAGPILPLLDAPQADVLPGTSQRLAWQEGRAFDARGPPRRT